jgi:hypothetical protein
MKADQISVEGELYLSLETCAEIYSVEVVWLREVFDQGLLGRGVTSGQRLCVAAIHLDRVATIVRLNQTCGLDLTDIQLELGDA